MRTLYQPAALEELREAIIWYIEAAGQRQAEAFNREINAKLELLKGHPLIGTPGIGGSRWMPLKRFPYTLHYRVCWRSDRHLGRGTSKTTPQLLAQAVKQRHSM
jgi:toxin ParE1/3/4